ncbi:neuroparsin-A-like [Condylostylus longicornis]|uniref:neuroparsin-A-like n=1 Tax=Condylostylus longicornis TaxID=2530218 RepID=UPI00244DE13B|nr:neuroparsin-A-like [Condylostylus longicornis]
MAPFIIFNSKNFKKSTEIRTQNNRKFHLILLLSFLYCVFLFNGAESGRIEQAHLSAKVFRCVYAKYKTVHNATLECNLGSYWDNCGRHVCYKDIKETCDEGNFGEMHGKCAPTLNCFCGICMGCTSPQRCLLELPCKRQENNFIDKLNDYSFIGSNDYS